MEDIKRRLEKMEELHPAHIYVCGETFKSINSRLEKGSVKFAEHGKEINYLKACTESIKEDVGQIKAGWNKLLSGVAVACVLLVINIIITYASNGH